MAVKFYHIFESLLGYRTLSCQLKHMLLETSSDIKAVSLVL